MDIPSSPSGNGCGVTWGFGASSIGSGSTNRVHSVTAQEKWFFNTPGHQESLSILFGTGTISFTRPGVPEDGLGGWEDLDQKDARQGCCAKLLVGCQPWEQL